MKKRILILALALAVGGLCSPVLWGQDGGDKAPGKAGTDKDTKKEPAKKEEDKKAPPKKEEDKKAPEKEKPKDPRFYFSQGTLSFLPPEGWMAIKTGNPSLAFFAPPEKYPNLNIKVLGKSPWAEKDYLLEALAEEIILRHKKKYPVEGAESKILKGSQGALHQLAVVFKGVKKDKAAKESFRIVQNILFYKEITVIFTFTAPEGEFKKSEGLFKKAFDSLKRETKKEK